MIYFVLRFSVVFRGRGGVPRASQRPWAVRVEGLLWHWPQPQEGKARGLWAGFRVTVPGFWLVSQGILFTAASAKHEAEFLEV